MQSVCIRQVLNNQGCRPEIEGGKWSFCLEKKHIVESLCGWGRFQVSAGLLEDRENFAVVVLERSE